MKFTFIHLTRFRVDNTRVFKVACNYSVVTLTVQLAVFTA